MDEPKDSSDGVSRAFGADTVALARAMSKALKAMEGVPAEIAGAVDEHVAAARLGISLSALRYDRRAGKLGIPFIKIGEGRRGLVRYDLSDLDAWVASKKRVPQRERVEQPAPEAAAPTEPETFITEEPRSLPARRPQPVRRSPWEPYPAPAGDDDDFADPFATGRSSPRRGPRGYFG